MQPPIPFSRRGRNTKDSPISFLMARALANSELISLAAGFVDPGSLPAAFVADAAAKVLAEPRTAQAALQYDSTMGHPPLREKVLTRFERAEVVRRSELNLSVDDVCISTGSQQMLYLLAEILLDEGDIVINSAPSYFVYSGLLDSFGVQVRSVVDDEGGMPVDGLRDLLESLKASGDLRRVKLIYAVSYFQNPTGISIAADRRAAIVELAKQFSVDHRILVLDDAAYRELRYDGPEIPSLKRYDTDNSTVIHSGTFSKPFSPGMKTGWSILPKGLAAPVVRFKGNHDFGSSNFNQLLIDRAMADGNFDRQIEKLRQVYRAKRDAMLEALDDQLSHLQPRGCRWIRPDGGLYVWLELPPHIDTRFEGRLFAAAVEQGVLYVPGDLSYTAQPGFEVPHNTIRLSFGVVGQNEIRTGIARLAQAVRTLI